MPNLREQNSSLADWLAREPAPLAEVDDDNNNAVPFRITMAVICLLHMDLTRCLKARVTLERFLRRSTTTAHSGTVVADAQHDTSR